MSISTVTERSSAASVRRRLVLGGRAALVAGPLFVGVALVLTWLEWGFLRSAGWSPFGTNEIPYPSYTALGRFGAAQVVNFFVSGLCVVLFVQALGTLVTGKAGVAGRLLLTITGLAIMTSSFRTDRVPGPHTWHGAIHGVSFMVVVLSSVLGLVFTGLSLRRVPGWRRWGRVTLWLAVWQVLCFTVLGGILPGDSGFYLFVLGLFGWVFLTGRELLVAADGFVGEDRRD